MNKKVWPWCLLLIGGCIAMGAGAGRAQSEPIAREAAAAPSTAPVAPGSTAPLFTVPDMNGKVHSLADYRGESIALFTFCGCDLCHQCAVSWSKLQRGGALPLTVVPVTVPGKSPKSVMTSRPLQTVILFHGDAELARIFATETQLDLKQTVLLLDEDEKVSETYQAAQCPRVFAVDRQGVIRYTNNEKGEESYMIPTQLIVTRAVDALRQIALPPVTPPPSKLTTKAATKATPTPSKKAAPAKSKPATKE